MLKLLISSIVCSTLFLGCGTTKGDATNDTVIVDPEKPVEKEVPSAFANLSQSDSLFASIYRGACFGKCPTYEMRIYMGGTVHLVGTRFVDKIGFHTTKLTKAEMLEFIAVARRIKFMDMEDEYDNPNITDLPETTTTIVIDGKRKSVRRRVGFPMEIKTYEQLFDDLLDSAEWIQERGGIKPFGQD